MTENKRFTYLDYSRDGHIGSFYLNGKPITTKEVWELLNEQDKQLQPFIELAKKHDKTIDELYRFMRSYLNSRNENTYWNPKNYR